MNSLWRGFIPYALIGIGHSVIHCQLFFLFRSPAFDMSQALSSFLAFCTAGPFALYANTLYTFSRPVGSERYLVVLLCMAGLSLAVGALGDSRHLPELVTVMVFLPSALLAGFLLSRWLLSTPSR